MNQKSELFLRRSINNENGQTLVWAALLFGLLLGVGGLTVDLGHAYVCYRELQASTDAAALAAASQLPITTSNESTNTTISTGTQYGAQSGKNNAYANLNTPLAVTGAVTAVTPGCVIVSGLQQCQGSLLANAVQVKQTVTIPTYFIRVLAVFGIASAKSITLSATSISQMRGAQRGPYNVAIILDSTSSMQNTDGGSNCKGTKIQCAEQGAQILLSEFSPCLPGTTCGTVSSSGNVPQAVDEVSLFTFPAQVPGTQLANDEVYDTSTATCSGGNPDCPTVTNYPDTIALATISSANLTTMDSYYQVVPLSSNYRPSDATATGTNPLTTSTTVNSTTPPSIVNAVGGNSYFGGTNETGMLAEGTEGTYYAGAIFTAQEYLAANARTNATNVIILLGDGDAPGSTVKFAHTGSTYLNSNATYPSSTQMCAQAVNVATTAKAAHTKIYVVGYGVASGGCGLDGGAYTACSALRAIASSDQNFFVDTSSYACPGATSVTMNGSTNTLSDIFTAIVGDLTLPRLLPSGTAFTAMPT